MKRIVAAVAIGLLLIAGQATAQNSSAAPRVGDRLGETAGESNGFQGPPLVPLLAVIAILVAGVVVASDDDSESD